jgi:hypothetical protein
VSEPELSSRERDLLVSVEVGLSRDDPTFVQRFRTEQGALDGSLIARWRVAFHRRFGYGRTDF